MSGFKAFLGSTPGLVTCLAAAAAGIYLFVFHLAHVALIAPYLILLACPLMHLIHRGHHDHGSGKAKSEET